MTKNIIAIPMGDPAGIGPEITVKALSKKEIYDNCAPLVIGNRSVIENAVKFTHTNLKINEINKPSEGIYERGTIDLMHFDNIDVYSLEIGKVQAQAGKAAFEYIK